MMTSVECRSGNCENDALMQFGVKKRCTVLSNYKADIYEAWQLWWERYAV